MSLRRDGRGVLINEGPQPAIVRPHTYGTRAVVGGTLTYGRPGPVDIQRQAAMLATRRLRAARRELGA